MDLIGAANRRSPPCMTPIFPICVPVRRPMSPDPVSAEELVNDVFVNIWEHRGRYRVPLHGYLVNSVRNACISHIRSQLFRRRLREGYERELLLFAEQRCLTDAHPLEVLSAQEVETRIRAVVETLPERCRAVFEQYFYRGESAREIAENLRIDPRHGTSSHQERSRPPSCRIRTVTDCLSFSRPFSTPD